MWMSVGRELFLLVEVVKRGKKREREGNAGCIPWS